MYRRKESKTPRNLKIHTILRPRDDGDAGISDFDLFFIYSFVAYVTTASVTRNANDLLIVHQELKVRKRTFSGPTAEHHENHNKGGRLRDR